MGYKLYGAHCQVLRPVIPIPRRNGLCWCSVRLTRKRGSAASLCWGQLLIAHDSLATAEVRLNNWQRATCYHVRRLKICLSPGIRQQWLQRLCGEDRSAGLRFLTASAIGAWPIGGQILQARPSVDFGISAARPDCWLDSRCTSCMHRVLLLEAFPVFNPFPTRPK